MDDEIHTGNLIRQKLKEQERSVSWFARKLHCDRSNIYKIFSKQHIDTGLLIRISKILDFDFFEQYSKKISKEKAKTSTEP